VEATIWGLGARTYLTVYENEGYDGRSIPSVMSRGRSLEKPDAFLRFEFRRVRAVFICSSHCEKVQSPTIFQLPRFLVFLIRRNLSPELLGLSMALVTQVLRAFTQNSDNLTRGAHESQGRAFKFLPGYRVIYA